MLVPIFGRVIFGLILIFFIACGGDNYSKRTTSLKGFEDSISLGEIKKESPEIKEEPISQIAQVPKNENPKKLPTISDEELRSNIELDSELNETNSAPNFNVNEGQKNNKQINPTSSSTLELGPLKLLGRSKSRIVSNSEDLKKSIILAERYRIYFYKGEIPTDILNSNIYEQSFNSSMPAISVIYQTTDHGLWIGFTNGEIVCLKNGLLSKRNGGPTTKRFSIRKIIEISGRIFVASQGLYEWDKEFDRFMSSDELKNEVITDISPFDEKSILFSTQGSIKILSLTDRSISTIYNSFTGDYPISSTFVLKDKIYVGGNQGILTLSKNGLPLYRFGSNYRIKKIIPISESTGYILTNSGKIGIYDNQTIYSLNKKSLNDVFDIFFSQNKNIFLALSNGANFQGSEIEFFKWILDNKEDTTNEFNKTYTNACAAAEDLLKNKFYSRQISTLIIDNSRYTFFKGIQTCPNNKGFMRSDGATVISNDNSELELFEFNNRTKIKLPADISNSAITRIFVDSNSNIYLGTKNGLYIKNKESWVRPENSIELVEDYISDMLEDSRGNIWISTRIKNLKDATVPNESLNENYAPLHLLTKNKQWAHFGKSSGLNTLGISSLEEQNNGIFLGTAYGFSILQPDSSIKSYSKSQGLKNFIVEDLNIDSTKRIWLSHGFFQNGLSWVDEISYYNITKNFGLFSDRIAATAEDDDGLIWVMDTSGEIGVYSPNFLKSRAKSSPFHLERGHVAEFKP